MWLRVMHLKCKESLVYLTPTETFVSVTLILSNVSESKATTGFVITASKKSLKHLS